MDHDEANRTLDRVLLVHPDLTVRMAWQTIRPSVRRVSRAARISSNVLPSIAAIAQRAVKVRDAIDTLIPALPPTMYALASEARGYIVEIIKAVSTGARDDDETPTG